MIDIISKTRLQELVTCHKYSKITLISIVSSYDQDLPAFPLTWDKIELCFDDIEPDSSFPNSVLMSEGQADDIIEFALDHADLIQSDKNVLYVECTGGVSRSAAVAAAISDIMPNTDSWWVFNNPKYVPNRYVYETIIKCYDSDILSSTIDAKFDKNIKLFNATIDR